MPVTHDDLADADTGPIRRIPAEPRARRAQTRPPTRKPGTTGKPPTGKPPTVDAGHGHGHHHGPAAPASRRVRLLLIWLLAPVAVLTVVAGLWLYPWGKAKPVSTYQQGT